MGETLYAIIKDYIVGDENNCFESIDLYNMKPTSICYYKRKNEANYII